MEHGKQMKVVYTIVERSQGKSFWTRIGVGFVNKDGSIQLKLDAIPTNGTIQVRDWEPRDDRQGSGAERGAADRNGELGFGSTNGSRRAHHQGDALL
ncbi:MAG: hypothetical protein KC657_21995 [Myxococcales bacterium]|nr:hypothetical protein [Myxococcales bacterium]